MKKVFPFLIIFSFLVFYIFISDVKAYNVSDILINEIAWMGTTNSANDEWIELLNTTDNSISLDGWVLKSIDGTPKVTLVGTISSRGFYLLERTDDNSVAGVAYDKIYTGALGNNGEDLLLYNSSGDLVDRANFTSGWTFGDNTTKQTIERVNLSSWQTSQSTGGTPKAQSSSGIKIASKPKNGPLQKNEKSDNSIATASAKDAIDSIEAESVSDVSNKASNTFNPWLLLLITIAVVICLAITYIVLKFNLFKR